MGMPSDFSLDCEVAPILYNHVRTYGLGPCPSQVLGLDIPDLRSNVSRISSCGVACRVATRGAKSVSDEITQLKNQYATVAAYMKSAGHPLPPSPNGDGDHTPSLMEHNGQASELKLLLVEED
ncbi:hypothetical protein RHSIM_Rhsim02G0190200 [Rhododendron simsii]|uniref:Uncharacterized protein n=1 Tax=Rhododendron simsii TaxID=118357 RepID=A0A834LWN2_RHOSS|nr:hypothetical protein RHSIM_Rhsim02G0190200 [Rhododendron simsii]